ncbi:MULTISPECIES: DUF1702 family protein [Actinomadura]|uniref:DUF1702 family protein n=1 Tax=Actinomadura yumaensis TaxID=111807 RepID=A0ABW2CMN5_9ACTN|nr:DUF1702 family protein [Actinomadura sp. J1-007]MWK36944.1 DUF1702 family protein [Actinomadura sp. J1-007]
MPTLAGALRRRLLMPDLSEVTFDKRGFHERDPRARLLLEHSGRQFLAGFGHAMDGRDMDDTRRLLETVERPFRGFAYEGASMAFTLTDVMTPWRRTRVRAFLDGPGSPHVYMAYVGIGWAMARLPRPLRRGIAVPDPLLRWLAIDGYGFHQAYFATQRYVREKRAPGVRAPWADPSGYAERVADQGIGRALWFVCGADVERLATVIGEFAPARRSDLWSGAGLAAAYAGGIEADEAETLLKLATGFRGELAQGCAFAAEARLRADLVTPDTRTAAQVFCRTSVEAAAAVTQDALVDLPSDGPVPAYELWRQRIRAAFEDVGG